MPAAIPIFAAVAAAVVTSVMTPKPKSPTMPTPDAPTPMPDAQEQDAAKTASIQDSIARRGRASTILTDQNNIGTGTTLGG